MPVVLLVHCDGANGSTTFTDVSPSAHTVTATGVTVSTTTPKFGTGSANISASAGNRLNVSGPADFNLGAGQFTIEAQGWFSSAPGGVQAVASQFGGSSNLGWFFGFTTGSTAFGLTYSTTGTNTAAVSGVFSPTLNTWYHLAVDRDASNVVRVYVDGAVIASATVAATIFASTQICEIGNDNNNTRGFPGLLDEIRINVGTAYYAGAFTPPTGPFGGGGVTATTWDPAHKNAAIGLTNGNLTATSSAGSGSANAAVYATTAISATVKQYFEVTLTGTMGQYFSIGVMNGSASLSANLAGTNGAALINKFNTTTSSLYRNGVQISPGPPNITTGQVIRVAIDFTGNKIWWAINNIAYPGAGGPWMGSGGGSTEDPATNTGGLPLNVTAPLFPAMSSAWTGDVALLNAGATAFAYAAPSGFVGIDSAAASGAAVRVMVLA
jgi:hypothetical protein